MGAKNLQTKKKKKKKRPIILEPAVFSGFLLAAPRVDQTQ